MFNKHLLIKNKKEEVLYLFIDYNYELSQEFNTKTRREKDYSIHRRAIDYIKSHKIDFKGTKIFLVVNSIIIGSLILGVHPYEGLKAEITPKYQYVEYLKDFGKPDINDKDEIKEVKPPIKQEVITDTPQTNVPKTTTPPKSEIPTKAVTPTKTPPISVVPNTSTPPSEPITSKPTPPNLPVVEQPSGKMVTLHRSNGTIEQISLEDYIVGVVGAEMPASFSSEALKAQSVAARTYTLKRIDAGRTLTDTTSEQVYKDVNQLKALWGGSFDTYYNKVKNAVVATQGEYLTYNGKYIDALFFSTSNGKTEDAASVWGTSYPYLVSVDSHWDIDTTSYLRDTFEPITTIDSLTGLNITSRSSFQVLSRTPGNRIDSIMIDGNTYTGKYLRELLGLRSTDFDIRIDGDNVIFTTRGYGHGVGMSQYGANGMAKEGYSYIQILNHYYPGTKIDKLS